MVAAKACLVSGKKTKKNVFSLKFWKWFLKNKNEKYKILDNKRFLIVFTKISSKTEKVENNSF